jgi:hypothetical protein
VPLPPLQHLDRRLPADFGTGDRRPFPAPVRSAPGRHSRLALALLPPPARLAGRARGRRAGPRAGRTSRRPWSPSARATGCLRGRTRSGRGATTKSSRTGRTSAGS